MFFKLWKNKVSLDANDIFSGKEKLRDIHDNILETRNKYAAHNDDENGHNLVYAYMSETKDEIIFAPTYSVIIPFGLFESFRKVLSFCEQKVIYKLNSKLDKIESKIGKKIISSKLNR